MKRAARENDLGRDSILPLVLRLAVPSMLAQFVNVLYSIVDRIYISNIPGYGELALAGVGVCGPVVTLITSFSFLFGLGGAPLLAMKLGEGNKETAEKILSDCFWTLAAFSVVVTVFFLCVKNPMLQLFGASFNTFVYADEYLTIYILGSAFALLSLGLNNFITCQGFSKIGMMTVLLGAVVNIALDPLFIFVFGLGVKGAAIATVIAQFCSCVWVIVFLIGKRTNVRIRLRKPERKIVGRVMRNGLSPFVIVFTDSLLILVFNAVLQRYGGAEQGDLLLAAATIVVSFMQIVTMPMSGITAGCSPILSFNYGARNRERVKRGFYGMLILCLIFAGVMTIFAQAVPRLFVTIFTDQAEVAETAVWGIRVYTSMIMFLAVQYACVDSMTALNVPKVAVTLSLTRKIVIMLTCTLVLPMFFGWEGAFFAEPIADFCSCFISGITFVSLINRILSKRGSVQEESNGEKNGTKTKSA